jgi:hypothetical protein
VRGVAAGLLLLWAALLGTSWPARALQPPGVGVPDPRWKYVQLARATDWFPVRMVAADEPWAQVVQDVQQRLGTAGTSRAVRVGFYGHGAFIPPVEVQQDLLFVVALGLAAEMDVMLFPHWQFPDRAPFWELPRQMLQERFLPPRQPPEDSLGVVVTRTLQQWALEHRRSTAQAVVRLAEGIHAFHTQHMTPSLAAFSNSALVIVRLGELLAQGTISDGRDAIGVPDAVRQGVYVRNIVTFGYPLPQGTVTPALRQRVQGTFVNVVPAHCWAQLGGNFPLRGAVQNVPVSWAPSHAGWPQLAPTGPEVALLGALLGGRADAQRLAAQLEQRPQGGERWARVLGEAVCAQLPAVDR